MVNMQLGEVIFGGVGSGLYGMIVMAVLAVFIAGLMVGRTPEYLGKKIEAREMKLAMLYVLIFPAVILIPTAIAGRLARGPVEHFQSGASRLLANPVRVHGSEREQWLRIRRAQRERALLQRDHSRS